MAQDTDFVHFIIDQIDEACDMSHRMMFGGCTLYFSYRAGLAKATAS
jgi:hypothetical protein